MQITLEKRKDGSVVLRLKRNDGTSDWQKQQGPNAAFFPLHDLTHYAVETELGIGDAFYGLVAAGWTIAGNVGQALADRQCEIPQRPVGRPSRVQPAPCAQLLGRQSGIASRRRG